MPRTPKHNLSNKTRALTHLRKVDRHFHTQTKRHHASLPDNLSMKRTNTQLFESLVSIVISQQLSTGAADAIFARVKTTLGRVSPESVRKARESTLRKAGLSGAKIKTIKEIAKAVQRKALILTDLKRMPAPDAAEKLMEIWGLGPWSVEMFQMFTLGHEDVFSPGDLGLVRAMEAIYGLPKNTSRTSLLKISENWAPYRTYASLLLWRTRDSGNAQEFAKHTDPPKAVHRKHLT